MRSGAASGHVGYFHEAFVYDSDEELLAVALPFLLDGVAAGEPTAVNLDERNAELVRRALPTGAEVTFLPVGDLYARPSVALRSYRELLASYVAAGAAQIRMVGELPPVLLGSTWDWWARYESAINHVYDDFPLWGICAYDRRSTPSHVLADVARTHPRVARPDGGHETADLYTDPMSYLTEPRPVPLDPVQRTTPLVELIDPTPARARAEVRAADDGLLAPDSADGLVIAVSEVVEQRAAARRAAGADAAVARARPDRGHRPRPGPRAEGSVRRTVAGRRRLRRRAGSLDQPPELRPRDAPPRRGRLHHPSDGGEPALPGLTATPVGRAAGGAGRDARADAVP